MILYLVADAISSLSPALEAMDDMDEIALSPIGLLA